MTDLDFMAVDGGTLPEVLAVPVIVAAWILVVRFLTAGSGRASTKNNPASEAQAERGRRMLGLGQSGPLRRLAQEVRLLAVLIRRNGFTPIVRDRVITGTRLPHDHWYGPADPMCRQSAPPNRQRPSSFDGGLGDGSSVFPF